MRLVEHPDAPAFLEAAGPLLAADEARHNLIYGICSTLIEAPQTYPEAKLWTVDDGVVVAALLMTPPYNLLVARPRYGDEPLAFAARTLHQEEFHLPGVGGAVPEVDAFAAAWDELTGARSRLRMSHGVYAARNAKMPTAVDGRMREAEENDRELVVEWMQAFGQEAMHHETPRDDARAGFDRRLASPIAGVALWEVDGSTVSLCGYGGRTPHGIRIGPVYTPPEFRGHGYASALTASATQQLLDKGYEYCFLYTDLANPTSNSIYTKIGYERVCDAADYAFD